MRSIPPKLYGIANCDTIKKAKKWLDKRNIAFEFHDYRKQGLDMALLQSLESALGWEAMVNRRGITWRALPEALKAGIDRDSALQTMLDSPAIIKRPILAIENRFLIGFSDQQYREIFS